MVSSTKRRTFDRATWERAQQAWADTGPWSGEWKRWRHLAAMEAGIIFPPEGSALDSWGDDAPSQRAVIIRAIRETPALLERIIRSPGVRTWGDVHGRLIGELNEQRDDIEREERDDARRRSSEPGQREAARSIADILDLIGGSR